MESFMQRLIVVFSLLVLASASCRPSRSAGETPVPTLEPQVQPQAGGQMETPSAVASPMPAIDTPGSVELLQGPDINYNGILFALDSAIGSRLYVSAEMISVDGSSASY